MADNPVPLSNQTLAAISNLSETPRLELQALLAQPRPALNSLTPTTQPAYDGLTQPVKDDISRFVSAKLQSNQPPIDNRPQALITLDNFAIGLLGIAWKLLVFLLMVACVFGIGYIIIFPSSLIKTISGRAEGQTMLMVLVTVTTITIALVLTVGVLNMDKDDYEKRFDQGKQIFTALIGILGTIIGFYFASAVKDPATVTPPGGVGSAVTAPLPSAPTSNGTSPAAGNTPASASTPSLGIATVSVPTVKPGGALTLTSTIVGNKPDFTCTITFSPDIGIKAENLKPAGDTITYQLTVPATTPIRGPVKILMSLRDASQQVVAFQRDDKQTFTIQQP